jgi:flagellar biosynthetic protein FlhB
VSEQKTEQPTQHRLQEARRQGDFLVSRELTAAVQFLAFVLLLSLLAGALLEELKLLFRQAVRFAFSTHLTPRAMHSFVVEMARRQLASTGLLLIVMAAAPLAIHLALTRFGLAIQKLKPDWKRLSPVSRLKQLPRQNFTTALRASLLLPLFATLIFLLAQANWGALLSLPLLAPRAGAATLSALLSSLLWKAALVLLIVGALDLLREGRHYLARLRMTRQEIRDEYKQLEGSPEMKRRIRRLQRDLARRNMMKEVRHATAVVVNPTHYAVALRYEPSEMSAPRVVAKGRNYLARRIREIAQQHQIPIVENVTLAQALYKSVEVGQEIPAHLYRAVAEILAYVYRLMYGHRPSS